MGGASSEHEVSLNTGTQVLQSLNPKKYAVRPIFISKKGGWLLPGRAPKALAASTHKQLALRSINAGGVLEVVKKESPVVFIAMHGPYGEDGTVQGLLELAGIPYTGSGVLASALAMNKAKSADVFRNHGISTPPFITFTKRDWLKNRPQVLKNASRLDYPLVVKPNDQGSSMGISIVRTKSQIVNAILTALHYSPYAMVQKYVAGREVTCAVIDKGIPGTEIALQPTEVIPKTSAFFDYHAKYTPGASEEITPPNLPQSIIRNIQRVALTCHRALGCSGMSRTDMIIENSKRKILNPKIYVLEVNTIPGMTETSLLPKAAKACGLTCPALLERIIEAAKNRHRIS
ncbi:MAG: D-alanine--D-alanine ligase [Parcubacteria group bacterium]|nr:D-alanine--D-alanine ligase [Parcubacteria group bacterium]